MLNKWKSTLLGRRATILHAIDCLDQSTMQIVLVVDDEQRLLGTITDGDIRRAILRSIPLDQPVTEIMNRHPTSVAQGTSNEEMLALMSAGKLKQVPVVNADGVVVGLAIVEDLLQSQSPRPNWVVLMAGGFGTRLRPLTENTPKPLLKVGDRPLLETILQKFIAQNFRKFFISVHYKSTMIKDYFGDGRQWGAEISYLEEEVPLGTAGALSLLPERPAQPLLVMNGDLLTEVKFGNLIDFHVERRAAATMAVREYTVEVPFGVVETDEHNITLIREKPLHRVLVNAGIYVLDPEVLSHIPAAVIDMPHLFNELVEKGKPASVYPVRESWIDIGRFEDLERARRHLGLPA